jgi:ABC-type polysaccharide/polyol phosphate transport system ATPase subunit
MELTGRENIFLNSALLGRTHQETRQLLQEIIGFAEIGEFIDAPIRTYSTGMVARLGFAVATVCVRISSSLMRCYPWATQNFSRNA